MSQGTVLVLEDNRERRERLSIAIERLGYKPRFWPDAPSMIAALPTELPSAKLISLDHDLNDTPGNAGTGLDVAESLRQLRPVCPVIVHTTNSHKRPSMLRELGDGGWRTDSVGPIGEDWVEKLWVPKAQSFLT